MGFAVVREIVIFLFHFNFFANLFHSQLYSKSTNRDFKFRGGTVAPDTTGWNVVTSAEFSPDGRSEKLHSLATTGGCQDIPGGKATFAGRNEQLSSVRREGDENNFTLSTGDSSDTHLQESSVTGDEKNGRVESKTSSSTSSSTRTFSKQFQSSDGAPPPTIDHQSAEGEFNEVLRRTVHNAPATTTGIQNTKIRSNVNIIDNNQQREDASSTSTITSKTSRFIHNEQSQEDKNSEQQKLNVHHQKQQEQVNRRIDSESSFDRSDSRAEDSTTFTADNTTSRVIRASDTLSKDQRTDEAFRLAALPGEILSRKVDYPSANTQMITEKKRLEDGTVVTTTRYEKRSASSEITAVPSDKRESSTSRVVTEDRATRYRTEVAHDDRKDVSSVQRNDTIEQQQQLPEHVLKPQPQQQQAQQHRRTDSRSEIIIQRDDLRSQPIDSKTNNNTTTMTTTHRHKIDVEDRSHQSTDDQFATHEHRHRVVKKDLAADRDTDRSYAPSEVSELSPRSHQTFDFNTTTTHSTTNSALNKDKRQEQEYHSNKRISVEVDSAHDSFARSLRSVSPTMINSTRSTTTSQSSLRSSHHSPDKYTPAGGRCPSRESDTSRISSATVTRGRTTDKADYRRTTTSTDARYSKSPQSFEHPDRKSHTETSPVRRTSPVKSEKLSAQSTVTKTTRVTKKQETKDTTHDYETESARSTSPTCTVSDIEYHPGQDVVNKFEYDCESGELTSIKTNQVDSTVKKSSLKKVTKDQVDRDEVDEKKESAKEPRPKAPYSRSETYEERCRQILGMSKKDSVENEEETNIVTTSRRTSKANDVSTDFINTERRYVETIERDNSSPTRRVSSPSKSPERKSPVRNAPARASPASSPERKPTEKSPIKSDKVTISSRMEIITTEKENIEKKPRSESPVKGVSPERIYRRPASPKTITVRKSSPDKVIRPESNYSTRSDSKPLSPERPVKKSDQPENRTAFTPKTIVGKPSSPKENQPETLIRTPDRKLQTPETSPTRKPTNIRTQSTTITTKSTFVPKSVTKQPKEASPDRRHITTAKVTISPQRTPPTIKTSSVVTTKKTTRTSLNKKSTHGDHSSDVDTEKEEVDEDESELLAKTVTNKRINKVLERKESAPVYRTSKVDHKMNRSASENVMKSSPIRRRSKPDSQSPEKISPLKPSDTKRPSKCITTKTINLSPNKISKRAPNDQDDDVIIDMQQAKSSREHSPNRMIPVPVSPDEDTGKPRFPDDVEEPEEMPRRRTPKVKDMPIMEDNTQEFMRCSITEIHEDHFEDESTIVEKKNLRNRVIEEDETDDCMLSVDEKVSKFINTAEEVRKPRTSAPFKPDQDAPTNVGGSDECLLSVTEKVSKFITTAEEVCKPKPSTTKDVHATNINDKVTQFLKTADQVTRSETTTTAQKKIEVRSTEETVNDDLKDDECLLSVSDKVNKFANTVEKLQPSPAQKSPELVAKIHRQVSLKDIVKSDGTTDDEEVDEPSKGERKGSITERYNPKEKPVTPTQIDIRRSDSMKRAKAIFEKNVTTKPKDILDRPSVWEGRRKDKPREVDDNETPAETTEAFYLSSPDDRDQPKELDRAFVPEKAPKSVPAYMRDTVSSKKNIFEKKISSSKIETSTATVSKVTKREPPKHRSPTRKSEEKAPVYDKEPAMVEVDEPVVEAPIIKKQMYTTPPTDSHYSPITPDSVTARRNLFDNKGPDSPKANGTIPSYMSHTVSSLEHIRKESMEHKSRRDSGELSPVDGNPRSSTKFGDSPNVEDIFDLELLEEMVSSLSFFE